MNKIIKWFEKPIDWKSQSSTFILSWIISFITSMFTSAWLTDGFRDGFNWNIKEINYGMYHSKKEKQEFYILFDETVKNLAEKDSHLFFLILNLAEKIGYTEEEINIIKEIYYK